MYSFCFLAGSEFDSLGGVLQPTSLTNSQPNSIPTNNQNNNNTEPSSALLTGDLESSLASLAENLTISNRPPPTK